MEQQREEMLDSYRDYFRMPEDHYRLYGGGRLSIMHWQEGKDGKACLLRDVDVPWEGENATRFVRKSDEAPRFANRFKFYPPSDVRKRADDYYTLVNWRTTPNDRQPEKDYVQTEVCHGASYIEVVVIEEAGDLSGVVRRLREGVVLRESNCRWAVTYATREDPREAVLLQSADFTDVLTGCWRLRSDCVHLPVFEVTRNGFVPLGESHRIAYDRLALGRPKRMQLVKTEDEIVKRLLLEAATKKTFLEHGLTTKEWQKFREVLQNLQTEGLLDRFSETLGWSRTHAKDEIQKAFVGMAETIAYDDEDSRLISSVAIHNPAVYERCVKRALEEWKASHKAEVAEQQGDLKKGAAELRKMKKEASQIDAETKKLRDTYGKLAEKHRRMEAEWNDRKSVVQEVERNVQKELEELQQHTAEAVARAMVAYPVMGGAATAGARAEFIEQPLFVEPLAEPAADAEGLMSVLQGNLDEIGVREERISQAFAAFAYACALRGLPMFFAGVSSVGLADALACGLYGEMPLLVDLPRTYSPALMQELEARPGRAMILANVFASEWIDHIGRLVNLGAKQLFFVAPFADDLALLPKGIAAYGLPILTDLLLDTAEPDGWTFSGSKDQDLYRKEVVTGAAHPLRSPYVRALRMMAFEQSRYEDVLALAHGLSGAGETDVMDALLCGVPYAYLHGSLASYWRGLKGQNLLRGEDATEAARVEALFGEEATGHA